MSQRLISKVQCQFGYSAEADFAQRESGLWHLRGAEGDRLTERSEGRKLPQLEPRALAAQGMLITLFGGASGGMQGGPRRGRSPITGPTLLRAAQASQTSPEGDAPCPKGRKIEIDHPNWANAQRRAGVSIASQAKIPCRREERLKLIIPTGKWHRTSRRRYFTPKRQNPALSRYHPST